VLSRNMTAIEVAGAGAAALSVELGS